MSKTHELTHQVGFDRVLDVTRQNLKARPKCGQGINSEICGVSGVDVNIPKLEQTSMALLPEFIEGHTQYPLGALR